MASRSWNRVELIGNLTRDPELRYTPNGAAVCTFGIATNRTYVTEGEKKEEVDFHRLVAWNKLAELCNQLLKKGNRVFISGRLQTRSWEGQDGQARQTTEVVIEDMILLTPRVNGETYISEDISIGGIPTRVDNGKQNDEKDKLESADSAEKSEEKDDEKKASSDKGSTSTREASVKQDVGDDDIPF